VVDAAGCELTRLVERLDGVADTALGGKRTAAQLRTFVRRTSRFLDATRGGRNVDANRRRALRQLTGFERAVAQGTGRKRRPIDPETAAALLSSSAAARAQLRLLQ
jgi:hypothetical protein